jgi:Bacterial archaeo-eukaryotic release factor family 3
MAEDPLPLVVAGTERDLAYFDEVTTHRRWIIDTLQGNYEDATSRELAGLTLPLLDAYLASRRASVAAELVEAIGTGPGVVGVKAAWDGPVALLMRF